MIVSLVLARNNWLWWSVSWEVNGECVDDEKENVVAKCWSYINLRCTRQHQEWRIGQLDQCSVESYKPDFGSESWARHHNNNTLLFGMIQRTPSMPFNPQGKWSSRSSVNAPKEKQRDPWFRIHIKSSSIVSNKILILAKLSLGDKHYEVDRYFVSFRLTISVPSEIINCILYSDTRSSCLFRWRSGALDSWNTVPFALEGITWLWFQN